MKKFLLAFAFCTVTLSSFANNEVEVSQTETAKKFFNEFCCTATLVVDGVVVQSMTSCATIDKATNCAQARRALLTKAPK